MVTKKHKKLGLPDPNFFDGGGQIIQATLQSVPEILRMALAGHASPVLYAEGRYWLRIFPEMKTYPKWGHLSIEDEFA